MRRKTYSWGMIILGFFFFFPVGIYLLVSKVTSEKHDYLKNGKILTIFGWILFGLGIFYVFMGLMGQTKTEDGSNLISGIMIMLCIFCGGGFAMAAAGKKLIGRANRFNRYTAIINASSDFSIDSIAKAYPDTYDEAVKTLQQMIDMGFITNTYLDLNNRELVMAGKRDTSVPKKKTSIVNCPNCGATVRVTEGADNECEYCRSPL